MMLIFCAIPRRTVEKFTICARPQKEEVMNIVVTAHGRILFYLGVSYAVYSVHQTMYEMYTCWLKGECISVDVV